MLWAHRKQTANQVNIQRIGLQSDTIKHIHVCLLVCVLTKESVVRMWFMKLHFTISSLSRRLRRKSSPSEGYHDNSSTDISSTTLRLQTFRLPTFGIL